MEQQIKREIAIMKMIRHRCVACIHLLPTSASPRRLHTIHSSDRPTYTHARASSPLAPQYVKIPCHDESYVVQLREVLASKTKIFIVLELVTGGELFDKLVTDGRWVFKHRASSKAPSHLSGRVRTNRNSCIHTPYIQSQNRFTETRARFYFQQLIEGVEYCHSQGVIHRDLKPENLLLDDQMNLKARVEWIGLILGRIDRFGWWLTFLVCLCQISDFGLSALYTGSGEGASRTTVRDDARNYMEGSICTDGINSRHGYINFFLFRNKNSCCTPRAARQITSPPRCLRTR